MEKMIVEMTWTFNPNDPTWTHEVNVSDITDFAKGTILKVESFPFGVYKYTFEVTKRSLAELIGCIPWSMETSFFSEGRWWDPDSFEDLKDEDESSEE